MREWGPPVADAVHVQSYITVLTTPEVMFPRRARRPRRVRSPKSGNLPTLTDEVIDIVVDAAERSPVAASGRDLPIIALWRLGGRTRADPRRRDGVHRRRLEPPRGDRPVSWRDAGEDERWIAWERGLAAALQPHCAPGLYLNFTSDDDDATIQEAFGANYRRLGDAKRTWDPDNVLRFNKNIASESATVR